MAPPDAPPPAPEPTIVNCTMISDPKYEGVLTVVSEHGIVMQFGIGCTAQRTDYGLKFEKGNHVMSGGRVVRENHFVFKVVKPGGWPKKGGEEERAEQKDGDEEAEKDREEDNGAQANADTLSSSSNLHNAANEGTSSTNTIPADQPPPRVFYGPIIDAGTLKVSTLDPNHPVRAESNLVHMNTSAALRAVGRYKANDKNESHKKVGSAGYTDLMAMALLHVYTVKEEDVEVSDLVGKVAESLSTGFLEKTLRGVRAVEGILERERRRRGVEMPLLRERETWRQRVLREHDEEAERNEVVFRHAAKPLVERGVLGKRKREDGDEDDDCQAEKRKIVVVGEHVEL